jgi:hypothetical protein
LCLPASSRRRALPVPQPLGAAMVVSCFCASFEILPPAASRRSDASHQVTLRASD